MSIFALFFALCFLLFCANGYSAGAGLPDALGLCRQTNPDGSFLKAECPKGMELVDTPSRSDAYTVRTADGNKKQDDPKSYVPDRLMDIHIRVTQADMKYIGLLIYAVSADSATELGKRGCRETPRLIPEQVSKTVTTEGGCTVSETAVGSWDLPVGDPFHKYNLGEKYATHTGAELKNYHHILRFKAPPAGTGTIYFRAIVKRGPTQTGEFYWPMNAGDLELTEAAPDTGAVMWVQGEAGLNCNRVCMNAGTSAGADMMCDAPSLNADTQEAMYEKLKDDITCKLPLLSSCASTAPSTEDNWCWFRRAGCNTGAATCEAQGTVSRLCPCKKGSNPTADLGSTASPTDPPSNGGEGIGGEDAGAAGASSSFSLGLLGLSALSLFTL